jgi:hypothetical protein
VAQQKLRKVRYDDATENGERVSRGGWHKPGRFREPSPFHRPPRCGCELVTDKGAYRDETVDVDGLTVHFYHQSPVVVTDGTRYRLDSCGYRTSTTKERINRYLPGGYRLFQRDYEWYVNTPDGETIDFEDGMIITP